MKKPSLPVQIIIGLVLGILWALLSSSMGWSDFIIDWIAPFGTIFINLLKLIAVPLVFASLIKGVASLSDISKLSRIGSKTIALYLVSTIIAVTTGLLIVNTVQPGKYFSEQKRIELKEKYASKTEAKMAAAANVKEQGPLQFMIDIVPQNIINASTSNKNMLQVIFFAILFGIAMILIPKKKSKPIKKFFDSLNDVILKIIDLIMLSAPYGVFALLGRSNNCIYN